MEERRRRGRVNRGGMVEGVGARGCGGEVAVVVTALRAGSMHSDHQPNIT